MRRPQFFRPDFPIVDDVGDSSVSVLPNLLNLTDERFTASLVMELDWIDGHDFARPDMLLSPINAVLHLTYFQSLLGLLTRPDVLFGRM